MDLALFASPFSEGDAALFWFLFNATMMSGEVVYAFTFSLVFDYGARVYTSENSRIA